jgi:hypothetical protein
MHQVLGIPDRFAQISKKVFRDTLCPERQGRTKRNFGRWIKSLRKIESKPCTPKGPEKNLDQFKMTEESYIVQF